MSKLIALVATAVIVGGERVVVQPGEPLPELTAHDSAALLDSGAAADPAQAEAAAKQHAREEAQSGKDFAQARERTVQETASTAGPDAGGDGAPVAPKQPKTPKAKE